MRKRKIDEPASDQVGARQRVELGNEPVVDDQGYGEWPDIDAELAAGVLSSDSDEGAEGDDADDNDNDGDGKSNNDAGAGDGGGGDRDADEEVFQSLLEEVELD